MCIIYKGFFTFIETNLPIIYWVSIKKVEKVSHNINQEDILKNLINEHIKNFHIIDNSEFDSYDEYIKLACKYLTKICSHMKSMGIDHTEKRYRNYNRSSEAKIKMVLLKLELKHNVIFLLKKYFRYF